jgi:hypothetical protein
VSDFKIQPHPAKDNVNPADEIERAHKGLGSAPTLQQPDQPVTMGKGGVFVPQVELAKPLTKAELAIKAQALNQ